MSGAKIEYDRFIESYSKLDTNNQDVRDQLFRALKYYLNFKYGKVMRAKFLKKAGAMLEKYPEEDFKYYYDTVIDEEISNMADRHLEKVIDRIRRNRPYDSESFITTPGERKLIEAERKAKGEQKEEERKTTRINKNGLNVTINNHTHIVIYQYKDGETYQVDIGMRLANRLRNEYTYQIIRECAKAGLHNKWIGKILGIPPRTVKCMALEIGANVTLTSKSILKKVPVIRVLDEDGMFIVEKPNPYLVKNEMKGE